MNLREHPRLTEFEAWFAKYATLVKPIIGEYYRAAGPHYTTSKAIISGNGALHMGGRWNSLGGMRIVYLSNEPETALREANENCRYHKLPLRNGMPKVVVAVAVKLKYVLDLTDEALIDLLPESPSSLLAEDWRALMLRGEMSASQAMSQAAFYAGFQGLLVPSKTDPNGVNLLVYPDRLTKKCSIKVLNAAELDKLGKSV